MDLYPLNMTAGPEAAAFTLLSSAAPANTVPQEQAGWLPATHLPEPKGKRFGGSNRQKSLAL